MADEDLEIIKRKGGNVLLYKGHQYFKNKTYKNGASIWMCSFKNKKQCYGSITIHDNIIIKIKEHSCESDFNKNEIDKQINKMKEAACENFKPMSIVYTEHITPLKDAGLELIHKIPSYVSIKTSLYNNRKKAAKVKNIIYKTPSEVEIPPKFESFILGDYSFDNKRIILFCSNESKNKIDHINSYFADGTFSSSPKPFVQLYTIHGDIDSSLNFSNIVPLIYVLMSDKTEESYIALFSIIKSQLPQINPLQFMTDYEVAAMNAIKKVFPETIIKGCFYHFSRALWRKAKFFGINKHQNTRRIVALCTMLPLLPVDLIMEGWSYIRRDIKDDEEPINKFRKYFEKQWLRDIDFIKQWSVNGELHRTTNFLEGWHHKLNLCVGKKGPNLMNLLDILFKDSSFYSIRMKGGVLQRRRKQQIERDEFIIDTNMLLISGEISVGHFLERVSWKGSLYK